MENEYLNEENYSKGKNKIKVIIAIIILIGLAIGGGLIYLGINRTNPDRIESLKEKVNIEKQNLISIKESLNEKNKPIIDQIKELERVPFRGFTTEYYEKEDKIASLKESIKEDTKTIDDIDHVLTYGCTFNHNIDLNNYCDVYNSLQKATDKTYSIPLYMFAAFIIIATLMMTVPLTFILKGREINSFMTEQGMPIAKEAVEKMGPTAAKVIKDIKDKIK